MPGSLEERLVRLRAPVDAAEPAGADLAFDPEFEAISQEVEKVGRVDTGPPNWAAVERGADRLLDERTRDLRLAIWSAAAKTEQRRWVGLAEGLEQYLELVKAHWPEMHPPLKRLRARINLHEWFLEQVTAWLEAGEVEPRQVEGVRATDRVLAALDAELTSRIPDFVGSGRLRQLLKRLLPGLPAPAADDRGDGPTVTHVGEATPTGGGITVASGSAQDRMRTAIDLLFATASSLLQNDADARGYRLRRAAMALRAEQLGMTAPEPPPPEIRERLLDLDQKQRFPELLAQSEAILVEHPMWLDAHRHAVDALTKLGPRYAEARDIANKEAVSLFVRLPGILSRRFSDGQPVASARTQEWLEGEMRRATTTLVVSSEGAEQERRFEEVRRLAAEGRTADAVSLAVGLANRAGDERGRFEGQLLAGKIAVEASHPAVARPLLEGLLQAVERHALEVWEPRLCVTLYGSLLACFRALDGSGTEERARELFDKLCKLDPAAAMRMGSG